MVLIVEDEKLLVSLLEVTLTSNGIRNMSAMSGNAALDMASRSDRPVELAVIDLGLPDTDGITVSRRLRELNPEVKILVTSGSYNLDVRKMVLEQGVDSIIWKPYDLDELLGRVESLLGLERAPIPHIGEFYPN